MSPLKNFSLKFIDVMVGIVLGLGFQWWTSLTSLWQFVAFIFVYLDIVDYWIDYGPSLKKFPPKKEIDVLLDVGIMFSLFLYIYTTQLTIIYFLGAFILSRVLDFFWLLSSKHEYKPAGADRTFVNTWLQFDLIEIFVTALLITAHLLIPLSPLTTIITYIIIRLAVRVMASIRYKRVHFA